MGLHHQPRAFLMEPSTTIPIAHFDKVHRTVMLRSPIAIIDFVYRTIHQHDASGAQQRHHSPVRRSDIAIEVMAVAVREHAFKVPPFLHHSRQEFRSLGIERRIKFHRYPQRGRRRHQMCLRHRERRAIMKTLFDGHVVPAENLHWVQPVNGCQRI